jgi:quinoprotein glucose dehydrogenase
MCSSRLIYKAALLTGALLLSASASALEEWPTYGHDYGDTRYSPLKQITPSNVARLKPVWTYHMRTADRASRGFAASENTPLVVNGVMVVSTPYGRVVALDAESGKQRWAYQVPSGDQPATRGVSYWPGNQKAKAEIVFGTRGGLLIALHADTGAPVQSFGKDGVVDLHSDAGLSQSGFGGDVCAGDLQEPHHHRLAQPGNAAAGRLRPGARLRRADRA